MARLRDPLLTMNESTFWMVWNPQGHAPTAKHLRREHAIAEAERLARQCRGQTFIVLESMCARVVDDMRRIEYERADDDLPF